MVLFLFNFCYLWSKFDQSAKQFAVQGLILGGLSLKAPAYANLGACAMGLEQIDSISLRMVINIGHNLGF